MARDIALDPEASDHLRPVEAEGRLSYLAFEPDHCAHCGGGFNTHIPSLVDVYYCSEAMLRDKWGDR